MKLKLTKTTEHLYTYCPLQNTAMINFTKEACDRGREVKFQNYSECNYNNYLKIVDRRWFEMKTLEKYASGMALHKFSFALESLHSLDFFWACEDSLWRLHPEPQISSFVFQDLHS